MSTPLTRLDGRLDAWLCRPVAGGAASLGLFRIIYSVFYLWHLAGHDATRMSGWPTRYGTLIVRWVRDLPPQVLAVNESVLAFALVLLMFGLWTRPVTAAVLVAGMFLEGYTASIELQIAPVFLVFYIPLFMLLTNGWGDRYALDVVLRARRGRTPAPEADWRIGLPQRGILIALSLLWFDAAVLKMGFGGVWLTYPDVMRDYFLSRNTRLAVVELPINPLAPALASNALITRGAQYFTLVFEFYFLLAVFGTQWRNLFFSIALLFHAINALWMGVTFTTLLIAYLLFVDWEWVRHRVWSRVETALELDPDRAFISLADHVPRTGLLAGPLLLATLIAVGFNESGVVRYVLMAGGAIDWRTIWYPILPFAVVYLAVSMIALVRPHPPQRHATIA
jgi:hypothetical protein